MNCPGSEPLPPNVVNDTFTLVVFVERRGPSDYSAVLPEEKPKAAPKAKGADAEKGKAKADETAKGKAKTKAKRRDDNQ